MGKPMTYTDGPESVVLALDGGLMTIERDVTYDVPGRLVSTMMAAGLRHDHDRTREAQAMPKVAALVKAKRTKRGKG